MKRSRLAGGANLYDVDVDISQTECELAKICYIANIDFEQIDDVTIDEIFFNLRRLFHYSSATFSNTGKPAFDLMRKQNFHLMTRARHCWYTRQIALKRKAANE
ncbi:MAG: hypothetical protein EBY38_06235 [Flavobacteriaceae bacterium]|jgi:hypothetical protein|nr:hypothetical protein [Flavobacteriaceae bacterium]